MEGLLESSESLLEEAGSEFGIVVLAVLLATIGVARWNGVVFSDVVRLEASATTGRKEDELEGARSGEGVGGRGRNDGNANDGSTVPWKNDGAGLRCDGRSPVLVSKTVVLCTVVSLCFPCGTELFSRAHK